MNSVMLRLRRPAPEHAERDAALHGQWLFEQLAEVAAVALHNEVGGAIEW